MARLSQNIEVQVGGGIRDLPTIARALDAGASAVVIGTMLFADPETVQRAVDLFGRTSIIAALDCDGGDVDGGEVKIRGWQTGSGHSLAAAVRRVEELGLFQVLLTDISRDGTGSGPNVPLYAQWARQCPDLRITASGGVRDAADLSALAAAGCSATVVGRALLSNSVTLESLQTVAFRSAKEASVAFRSAKEATVAFRSAKEPPFRGAKGDDLRSADTGLAVRVIPCLDVTEGRVVKGTNFEGLRDAGDPVELARRYCDEGADELVFLDITATSGRRSRPPPTWHRGWRRR